MQGPSAIALRQGGQGGALKYKVGVQVVVAIAGGGPTPAAWKKKTTLQGVFGEFGQVLEIHTQDDGTAIIEYEDQRDAQDAAQSMDGTQICGSTVNVKVRRAESSLRGGGGSIDDRITEMAGQYGLDATSAARLVSAFRDRTRRGCNLDQDIRMLSEHLAASNKPSALVCMKLADLRDGKPIGPCRYGGERGDETRGGRDRGGEEGDRRDRRHGARSRSRDRRDRSRERRSRKPSRDRDCSRK